MTAKERWNIYLLYLQLKVEERDWHGVQDCGSDLRELEAAYPELKQEPFPKTPAIG